MKSSSSPEKKPDGLQSLLEQNQKFLMSALTAAGAPLSLSTGAGAGGAAAMAATSPEELSRSAGGAAAMLAAAAPGGESRPSASSVSHQLDEEEEKIKPLAIDFPHFDGRASLITDHPKSHTLITGLLSDMKMMVTRYNAAIGLEKLKDSYEKFLQIERTLQTAEEQKCEAPFVISMQVASVLSQLNEIILKYKAANFLKYQVANFPYSPPEKKEPSRFESLLVQQQKFLRTEARVRDAFSSALSKIKEFSRSVASPGSGIFNSICIVASEIGESSGVIAEPYLRWVPDFLYTLKNDLLATGISSVTLISPRDLPEGGKFRAFMRKLETADVVLLFETEGLYKKHNDSIPSDTYFQLIQLRKRWNNMTRENRSPNIIEILISGGGTAGFPLYSSHFDCWNNSDLYFNNFRELVAHLHGLSALNFVAIWDTFLKSLSPEELAILGASSTADKSKVAMAAPASGAAALAAAGISPSSDGPLAACAPKSDLLPSGAGSPALFAARAPSGAPFPPAGEDTAADLLSKANPPGGPALI